MPLILQYSAYCRLFSACVFQEQGGDISHQHENDVANAYRVDGDHDPDSDDPHPKRFLLI